MTDTVDIPLPRRLEEKIGQMLLIGFRGMTLTEADPIAVDVRLGRIGGVILFDQEMAEPAQGARNIRSPEQVRELVGWLKARSTVPLLVAIDQEGGRVNRLKPDYGFPPSLSHEDLGVLGDVEKTREAAGQTARTLAELGFNLNLAPVVDLDCNPDNPIIKGKKRSFSSDPETVAAHAAAFMQAHREQGVLTCAKHFPGHGSAQGDTHLGLVDVTRHWTERELIPYRRLIGQGLCDVVMSAHIFNAHLDSQHPATLSGAVLGDLLRGRLGYEGVVMSDDMEMRAISSHYGLERSIPMAILAGVDLLCFGNNMSYDAGIAARAQEIILRAVQSGTISTGRIEEACGRILRLKNRMRLGRAGRGL